MSYESLFKPIVINNVEIKNRIVMSPMALNDAYPPGYASEQTKAMYAARVRGGVGLVILGGTFASKWAWDTTSFPGTYWLFRDEPMCSILELVERVHAFDAKIFVQLMHCLGRQGSSKLNGIQPVSCTAEPFVAAEEDWPEGAKFPGGVVGEVPRELAISEIVEMEDDFAEASLRAIAVGFDGMEICAHHGYLVFSFLSPRVNKRTDLYGGKLQNRMRFLLNTIHKTRDKIGPDFPLGIRLVCNEHVKGGLTIEECVEIAKILESEGVDYINLADGCYETAKYVFPEKDGTLLEHGEPQAFKKALKIPVITPSINDPDMAEAAVAEGKTDMVEMGRQLLADPEWANKVKEGKISEITKCDRDNFCLLKLFLGLPIRCKLNPNMGRERYMPEYLQPPYKY